MYALRRRAEDYQVVLITLVQVCGVEIRVVGPSHMKWFDNIVSQVLEIEFEVLAGSVNLLFTRVKGGPSAGIIPSVK